MHRGYNDNTQNVVKGHLRMNLSHESKEKKNGRDVREREVKVKKKMEAENFLMKPSMLVQVETELRLGKRKSFIL